MDAFTVIAEPTRRRILAELRESPRCVGELVTALDLSQPLVSKHLRTLREEGFVSCRGSGQRRIYQLESEPFEELNSWIEPYQRLWEKHLDALERHLNKKEDS